MKPAASPISSCRHCQFYQSEGRRGGHCQQLGVPVQGGWKTCSLAIPPFSPSWAKLGRIMAWHSSVDMPVEGYSQPNLPSSVEPEKSIPHHGVVVYDLGMVDQPA